jgi:hypothetical protein
LRKGDFEGVHQIGSIALEARILLDLHVHIQVPGRPSLRAAQPLARNAQRLAVVDTCWKRDLDRTLDFDLRRAVAGLAVDIGDAAHALTAGTGRLQQERAARVRDLACALARRAHLAPAAFGTRAIAGRARARIPERHFMLGAEGRVLERESHHRAQIGAALRAAATCTGAERTAAAEEVAEDVAEAAEDVLHVAEALAGASPEAGMAKAIVGRALLDIDQDAVGLGALLEPLLGAVVARVAVGVQFER